MGVLKQRIQHHYVLLQQIRMYVKETRRKRGGDINHLTPIRCNCLRCFNVPDNDPAYMNRIFCLQNDIPLPTPWLHNIWVSFLLSKAL